MEHYENLVPKAKKQGKTKAKATRKSARKTVKTDSDFTE